MHTPTATPNGTPHGPPGGAAHLTEETFEGAIRQAIPALVDFGADWCPPCRAIAPAVDQLARDEAGRLHVYKVDVDEAPQVAARYGVAGLPTLILFKDGEPVERLVGYRTKAQLLAAVAPHLGPPPTAVEPDAAAHPTSA